MNSAIGIFLSLVAGTVVGKEQVPLPQAEEAISPKRWQRQLKNVVRQHFSLCEEKVRGIREYVRKKRKVLMVGDGVNDASALASSTVGMALGAQGLTAAASVADAVLLSTEILQVVSAVHIGRRALHIALQGIWLGMGLSVIAICFAAYGTIDPAAGAILQEGIDVLVILNTLRVGRTVSLRPNREISKNRT